MTPLQKFIEFRFVALGFDPDGAVGLVAGKSVNAQPLRFTAGGVAKENSLHPAGNR
jgi:hypothetical protein